MKIVIAIDSFKGSLTSAKAAEAIGSAASEVFENAEILALPIADGGEGTTVALTEGLGGRLRSLEVTGPLGDRVTATYGISGGVAIIEMSEAAGLPLVPTDKRNPLYTTTYGVGEMILDAIDEGCRSFIIGIGGSATNDGGAGMLQALGFDLADGLGKAIPLGAIGLSSLVSIGDGRVSPILRECSFRVACDVTNPLFGERGASRVYGPQKGADGETVEAMDKFLSDFSEVARKYSEKADPYAEGAGAAGGMGFALATFLDAKLVRGVDLILDAVGLDKALSGADLVITGEGRLDGQTAMGKAPIGVAKMAKRHGIPVIALSGCIGDGAEELNRHGIDAFFPILRRITTAEEAMAEDTAYNNLKSAARQVFLLLRSVK